MKQTMQIWRLALFAILAVAFTVATSQAQGSGSKEQARKMEVGGELQTVQANGSKSLALKVTRAMDDLGNEIADLNGQTVRLAADAKTRALGAKYRVGAKLLVRGSYNAADKTLTVMTYKADDAKGSDSK